MIRIAALLAFCLSSAAMAQSTYGQYYDYISKVRVNPFPDDFLYISVPGNFSADHGCPFNANAGTGPFWARSESKITNEVTKAQMQIAMASFLSRGKVFVETRGCDTGTNNSRAYPILRSLQIEQE